LEGRFIGAIDIRNDHSTVDLPAGMPREIFAHLKRVRVCGRPLQISVLDGNRGAAAEDGQRPPRKPRRQSDGEAPMRAAKGPKRPPRRDAPPGDGAFGTGGPTGAGRRKRRV
jgi:ATP-dependent RNA helicase DeaD